MTNVVFKAAYARTNFNILIHVLLFVVMELIVNVVSRQGVVNKRDVVPGRR